MQRVLTAVILAGRIRPSPLRDALDVHVLCLPVGPRGSLLDAWLETLQGVPGLREIQVVVNTPAEVDAVTSTMSEHSRPRAGGPLLRIVAEPAAWRGAGGMVRDVTVAGLPGDSIVIVCEGKRLPPPTLTPLVARFENAPDVSGVVGVSGEDAPAGIYAFTRQAIDRIPRVGYFDLKEQFLPALNRNGDRVMTAKLGDAVWRLHDRESYLATVRASLCDGGAGKAISRVSERASISGSAVLDGCCVVEAGAVIEDGAVVHDSVVLWGATVGGGAVVSRSVIGPLASVEPRARMLRSLVSRPDRPGRPQVVERELSIMEERPTW